MISVVNPSRLLLSVPIGVRPIIAGPTGLMQGKSFGSRRCRSRMGQLLPAGGYEGTAGKPDEWMRRRTALCRIFVLRAMRNWCGSGAYRQNWRRRRYGLRRESFRNQSNSRPSFGRLLFLGGTPHRSLTSPYPFCPGGILTIRLRLPIYLHIRNTYHVKKVAIPPRFSNHFFIRFLQSNHFLSYIWRVLFSMTTIYCAPLRPQTAILDF